MIDFVGKEPERLSLRERRALAGQWIAVEIYNTRTLPQRRIAAVGHSVDDCMRRLSAAGADLSKFEFQLVTAPF